MKPHELEQKIKAMTDQQFAEFQGDLGGGLTRQGYVNDFHRDPSKWESKACQLLGIPTEADRAAEQSVLALKADQEQAQAARDANDIAKSANRISLAAALISVVSLIISIVALTSGK